jgi:hypothetical protein
MFCAEPSWHFSFSSRMFAVRGYKLGDFVSLSSVEYTDDGSTFHNLPAIPEAKFCSLVAGMENGNLFVAGGHKGPGQSSMSIVGRRSESGSPPHSFAQCENEWKKMQRDHNDGGQRNVHMSRWGCVKRMNIDCLSLIYIYFAGSFTCFSLTQ